METAGEKNARTSGGKNTRETKRKKHTRVEVFSAKTMTRRRGDAADRNGGCAGMRDCRRSVGRSRELSRCYASAGRSRRLVRREPVRPGVWKKKQKTLDDFLSTATVAVVLIRLVERTKTAEDELSLSPPPTRPPDSISRRLGHTRSARILRPSVTESSRP